MKKIFTPDAPKPAGHYSQAIIEGNLVFVSGQLPVDPATGSKVTESIEAQTLTALANMEAILKAAGGSREQVCKTTLFISDISLWDRVNKVYADFFGSHKPARSVVPTKELHHGFQIEVEAVAVLS